MKTSSILITIASLFTTSIVVAQYSPDCRNNLEYGIKGGANYSNVYDVNAQNVKTTGLFGPVFGGFLSIPLGTYLGVQPEILYSAKGYSGQGTDFVNGPYSYTERVNFLDLPLMLQLKPFPNLYILGGAEYSYLLSSSYTFIQNDNNSTTQQSLKNLRRNVFGLIFGFDLNFGQCTIGARIAGDLQGNNGNGASTLPRYRNVWAQLTLGFRV